MKAFFYCQIVLGGLNKTQKFHNIHDHIEDNGLNYNINCTYSLIDNMPRKANNAHLPSLNIFRNVCLHARL